MESSRVDTSVESVVIVITGIRNIIIDNVVGDVVIVGERGIEPIIGIVIIKGRKPIEHRGIRIL
jgi:hypothetical protein